MRAIVVVVVVVVALARGAVAQPSATPPVGPVRDWKPVSASVSLGIISLATNPFGLSQDDAGAPGGVAPWIEAEVSARRHRFGVAAVASYLAYHDGSAWLGYSCSITGTDNGDIVVQAASVGARARVYAGRWSFGLGALASLVITRGTHTVRGGPPCTPDGTFPLRDTGVEPTFELLVGRAFRRLGPIQPELTLAASGTGGSYVGLGGRVALGARF